MSTPKTLAVKQTGRVRMAYKGPYPPTQARFQVECFSTLSGTYYWQDVPLVEVPELEPRGSDKTYASSGPLADTQTKMAST